MTPETTTKIRVKTPEEIAKLRADTAAMFLNPAATEKAKDLVDGDIQIIPPGAKMLYVNAEGETIEVDLNPTEYGQYAVTFPGRLAFRQVVKSESGKSMVATVRVDIGKDKSPIMVEHPTDPNQYKQFGFGSFNINLSLTNKV